MMPLDQRYALPDQDFFAYFKVSGSTMKPVLNLIQEQEKKKKKTVQGMNGKSQQEREKELQVFLDDVPQDQACVTQRLPLYFSQ